jgi:hypothetical protein
MEHRLDLKPPSLQSILQKRTAAKKMPTCLQNAHWSVPNDEKPVHDKTTLAFNDNGENNWNKFYEVCGDLCAKYGERATKRQHLLQTPDAASNREEPRGVGASYDSVMEQLVAKEIQKIEETKKLLNLERIKIQIELLRLLEERLDVANQQDNTAVELLKLWQNNQNQNSLQSELATRAKSATGQLTSHDEPSSRHETNGEETAGLGSLSSLQLSTGSALLLQRVVLEHSSITLPTVLNQPSTQAFESCSVANQLPTLGQLLAEDVERSPHTLLGKRRRDLL